MTLREFVENYPDDKTLLHIGSGTSYIMVVTKAEFADHCKHWSEHYRNLNYEKLDKALEELKKDFPFTPTYEDDFVTMGYCKTKDLKLHKSTKKTAAGRADKIIKDIRNYRDFEDREVTTPYNRITGGVAVLVSGSENGSFWDREEYERRINDRV